MQLTNPLFLFDMKAIRIKEFDYFLNVGRFEIVLLKNIIDFNLSHSEFKNEAYIQLDYIKGQFSLSLVCDETQYEKFKLRWESFQHNEDYYFDLSEWGSIK